MKKVHITLVGGQPAPIYNGIIAIQPDKVIYIYSEASKNVLDVLKNKIDIESEEIMLDVTSPSVIKQCAETLRDLYKDSIVTVNITSGLKSWSHWFGVTFHNQSNAMVVYVDQNNVLWNYKTLEPYNINFDMRTIFKLYGNELVNYTQFSEYTQDDFDAIETIETLRNINIKTFNNLTLDPKPEQIHNFEEGICIETSIKGDYSCLRKFKNKSKIEFVIFTKRDCHEVSLESPHVKKLVSNANWFELKVAKLLSKWNKTKEICMNCHFTYKKDNLNEVDIIVDTGSKILFVECKIKLTKITDIGKFNSVIKSYGGISSKGIFITNNPMDKKEQLQCEKLGILYFSLQNEHLNIAEALYKLLDNELYNINTK